MSRGQYMEKCLRRDNAYFKISFIKKTGWNSSRPREHPDKSNPQYLRQLRWDRRRFTSAGGVLKTMLFLQKTILEVYQHNQECLLWGLRWTDTYPPMCHQFNITAAQVSANRLLMARGTKKTTANFKKKKKNSDEKGYLSPLWLNKYCQNLSEVESQWLKHGAFPSFCLLRQLASWPSNIYQPSTMCQVVRTQEKYTMPTLLELSLNGATGHI